MDMCAIVRSSTSLRSCLLARAFALSVCPSLLLPPPPSSSSSSSLFLGRGGQFASTESSGLAVGVSLPRRPASGERIQR